MADLGWPHYFIISSLTSTSDQIRIHVRRCNRVRAHTERRRQFGGCSATGRPSEAPLAGQATGSRSTGLSYLSNGALRLSRRPGPYTTSATWGSHRSRVPPDRRAGSSMNRNRTPESHTGIAQMSRSGRRATYRVRLMCDAGSGV